jgi:hypothetical protein
VRHGELFGQNGNDYIAGSNTGGNDLIVGGDGDDRLQGLAGNDIIWGDNIGNVPGDGFGTGPGRDRLNGGNGNDRLYGGGNLDYVYGENGDDIVYGDDGNDTIGGGAGLDIVIGGAGNDRANGNAGRDLVIGGDGIDTADGDQDDDIVVGDMSIWDSAVDANLDRINDHDAALLGILLGTGVAPGTEFWNSATPYGNAAAGRVANMRSQGTFNAAFTDDGDKDTIVGDLAMDWYWDIVGGVADVHTAKLATELTN